MLKLEVTHHCVRSRCGRDQKAHLWVGIPYVEAGVTVNHVPSAHQVRLLDGPPAFRHDFATLDSEPNPQIMR